MTKWSLSGLTWTELLRRIWRQTLEDDLFGRSAQLAFYFLLALFPLLLFLMTLLGYFASTSGRLRESFILYLSTIMPRSAVGLVNETINEITDEKSGGKLSFGLLTALWAASNGMGAITETLNVAYDLKETRPWWKVRLVSLGLTVLLAVLIISALLMVLFGGWISGWLAGRFGFGAFSFLWNVLQWPVVLAFLLLSLGSIYYFAPNFKVKYWQWTSPGALVALVLWLLVSFGFRTYLQFFNTYTATYGSLGALIVLMLWFYLTGLAILIGGELNSELESAERDFQNGQ